MPIRCLAFALLFLSTSAVPAAMGVPNPTTSSVPACLVACPAGDVAFHVVVRDVANLPIVNATVEVDLSECPGLAFCPTQGPGVTYDPASHRARMLTDASGVADLRLKLGGACAAGARVYADGVMLRYSLLPVASPDQNADLLVAATDVAIATALLGTSDPRADFDCDGTVTAADLAWLSDLHGGHSCDNTVPARASNWGTLKLHYR